MTVAAEEYVRDGDEEVVTSASERPPMEYEPPLAGKTGRVVSLDALRGFDMFWILGADAMFRQLGRAAIPQLTHLHETAANLKVAAGAGWLANTLQVVYDHLEHVSWQGFHFYDLIFPLFVFIVGVSCVFSLTKLVERSGRGHAVARIVTRSLLLWMFGVFVYGGFAKTWPELRLVGVLQRIAAAYLVTGLLFVYFRPRTLAIVAVALLATYWGVMTFVKAPGEPKVSFEETHNVANWIDAHYLPGRKWDDKTHGFAEVPHDPEGLLSTIPAIATCLLGVFAGLLLRNGPQRPWQKAMLLIAAGAVACGLGWVWGLQFPIIKKLWTSSFVLYAGGLSAALLGFFYLVVDVAGFRWWAKPFVWIGANAIFLYMCVDGGLIQMHLIATRLTGGNVAIAIERHWGAGWPEFVTAATAMLLTILLARFLYKREIFLRL